METCLSIITMDRANSDEGEAMVCQIYETFLHNVVTDVSIMKPNSIEHYELEQLDGLKQVQAIFKDLESKTTLIMISTTTPYDRLGITFKFHTDRITIEQLHDLSILSRISEGQHITSQLDAIYRETSLPGSHNGLGNSAMLDQEGQHIAARLDAISRETSRTEF